MKNRIDVLEISLHNIHEGVKRFGEPGIYIDCIYFMQSAQPLTILILIQ